MNLISLFVIFRVIFSGDMEGLAADLNEEALFHRCHAHIARQVPVQGSSLVGQVRAGSKSAVDACMEVLSQANLSASNGTQIGDTSDKVSLGVLHNFHSFHSTWFQSRSLAAFPDDCVNESLGDLYDATTPALYVTRSLFSSAVDFSEVVQGNGGLEAIRTDVSSGIGARSGRTWIFKYKDQSENIQDWLSVTFATVGDLLGVKESLPELAPPLTTQGGVYGVPHTTQNLNLDVKASLGGGLLGHQSYLLANIGESPGLDSPHRFSSNGAEALPRRWAKSVYKDLLCRDLPVVRLSDAKPFVRELSSVGFRRSNSCTQCHASMDRMAFAIRDFKFGSTGACSYYSNQHAGSYFIYSRGPASLPANAERWPSEPDTDFSKRPNRGVLYYRGADGGLVNKAVNGLNELGSALAEEDDLYICAAKRYFRFFTGIDVNVSDISDPLNTIQLNSSEKSVRDLVIRLGKSLKGHQDLKQLVREIISLPLYKDEIYGTGGGSFGN